MGSAAVVLAASRTPRCQRVETLTHSGVICCERGTPCVLWILMMVKTLNGRFWLPELVCRDLAQGWMAGFSMLALPGGSGAERAAYQGRGIPKRYWRGISTLMLPYTGRHSDGRTPRPAERTAAAALSINAGRLRRVPTTCARCWRTVAARGACQRWGWTAKPWSC